MSTEALLQHFLMYVVVPVWLLAGVADYFCHRASDIERTSGVAESLLHLLQFALVGIPLLAALFLEINAAILLIMVAGLVLHQATAVWDVSYANATRRVTPAEQHVHGVLEMAPAIATAAVAILHWPDFLSLFGMGEARFSLDLKHAPLPSWYLGAVMLGVLVCGVLPYGEELLRTLRAAAIARGSSPMGIRSPR
jgi:hypothetical protein